MTDPSSQDTKDAKTEQPSPAIHSGAEALDVLSRFVSAIEHTPIVAIQSISRDGIVRFWNSTSANIYGIPAQDAIGAPLTKLLTYRSAEGEFAQAIEQIWDSGQPILPRDWQVTSSSGKELWVYSTMFPVFRAGRAHQIFCMDVDITVRKKAEQALLAIGANFRTLFERTADAIMLIEDGRFLDVNPAAMALFGYADKSDMVGLHKEDISPPTQPDGSASKEKAQEVMALAKKHGNHRVEWLHVDRNNKHFWAELLYTEIPVNGTTLMYVVVRDISERKAAEQSVRLAAQVFENSHEGILIADKDQKIISMNRALSEITGYSSEEVIGKSPQTFGVGSRDEVKLKIMADEVRAHDHWHGEMWARHRDGRWFPLWLSVTAVHDSANEIVNYIGILTDISERKTSEALLRHLAEHDFLTGLPNRVLLLDRLQQAIGACQRKHTKLAVLFLDLDRFKSVNDSFGHQVGDKLLQTVGERLKNCVRGIDTVSRLGGDEFIVMLVDVNDGEPIAHIADNILNAICVPYAIENCDFRISTCIGISTYPSDGADTETLIKNADIAMYHAKQKGPNRYQFFDAGMNTRIVERIQLESNLREALKGNEFILQYQPQLNISGTRTIGAEALIRWQHPEFGLLLPGRFIQVAEECGMIVPIGDWVLRTACLQAKSWQKTGTPVVVAVNISVAQFHQKNLLQSIIDALNAADLEPQYLELEITESILMDEAKTAIETLGALRNLGVKLAIDDFGTGFSSLSYLKRIPLDKLKIDQSFVHDITLDPEDAAIINAIIVMAKSLNLTVNAEGVETLAQFQFLESHGCDEYQGYYSSKELSPQEFTDFLLHTV